MSAGDDGLHPDLLVLTGQVVLGAVPHKQRQRVALEVKAAQSPQGQCHVGHITRVVDGRSWEGKQKMRMNQRSETAVL